MESSDWERNMQSFDGTYRLYLYISLEAFAPVGHQVLNEYFFFP